MFKATVFLFAAALALSCLAGSRPSGATAAAAAQTGRASQKASNAGASRSSAANASQAKNLFLQNCARCHGADGRGQTELGEVYGSPDLTEAKRGRQGERRLAATIARGRAGMPGFARKLSKGEIAALAAYVRGFSSDGGSR